MFIGAVPMETPRLDASVTSTLPAKYWLPPSTSRSFRGSVDELARAIDDYEALGIDHLIVLLQPMTEASIERLAAALARR